MLIFFQYVRLCKTNQHLKLVLHKPSPRDMQLSPIWPQSKGFGQDLIIERNGAGGSVTARWKVEKKSLVVNFKLFHQIPLSLQLLATSWEAEPAKSGKTSREDSSIMP